MAYDRLEPFGEMRADIRMAILACVTARAAGSKHAKPSDFMPDFGNKPKQQTAEQMMRTFDRFTEGRSENG